jgi:UPF0271 protein
MGDRATRVDLPAGVSRASLHSRLLGWPGVEDFLVGDRHLLVQHAPGQPPSLLGLFENLLGATMPGREHVVRVRYDGPDLDEVTQLLGITREELIARHTGTTYDVQLIGFLPGFAYLGPVDALLARVPRRATPRPRVPALSVGLAAGRTAIYPFASPGGWQLLGTALRFRPFSPEEGPLLKFGDRVRFAEEA